MKTKHDDTEESYDRHVELILKTREGRPIGIYEIPDNL